MSTRAALWISFLAVHLLVALMGWWWPNLPMGDVALVYEPWSRRVLGGYGIPGVTEPFVYPVLALLPMLLTALVSSGPAYFVAWAMLVTALDALAFALLLGRGRSLGRVRAAWFWLGFLLLLGPIGMYRIDAVTVPAAVAALLWILRRPVVAGVLLSVASWIKVWPGALLVAAVVALRRRALVVLSFAVVTFVVAMGAIVAGGARHLLDFVGAQTGRGLQVEAPVSTVVLWQAVAGVPGARVFYDTDILTFQVQGPGVDVLIPLMTPLLVVAFIAVVLLGVLRVRRGVSVARLLPPFSLALVSVLIVVNKVGSPQFQSWLIAPLVLWFVIDRVGARVPAVLALVIAVTTHIVYPLAYDEVLSAEALPVAVLTIRNLLSVVLLVVAVVAMWRLPGRAAASSGMMEGPTRARP